MATHHSANVESRGPPTAGTQPPPHQAFERAPANQGRRTILYSISQHSICVTRHAHPFFLIDQAFAWHPYGAFLPRGAQFRRARAVFVVSYLIAGCGVKPLYDYWQLSFLFLSILTRLCVLATAFFSFLSLLRSHEPPRRARIFLGVGERAETLASSRLGESRGWANRARLCT